MSGTIFPILIINSAFLRHGGDGVLNAVNTIVRLHDATRLSELRRCVFSLVGQTYRPINVILTLQRFTATDVTAVETAIKPLIKDDDGITLSILNYEEPEPADARANLLNLGIQHADGGYLAFLDYDDVLYPEAYQLLAARLKKTGAAIAFADVRVMRLNVYDQFLYAERKVTPPFGGSDLVDLFRGNFCPLHSYLIDHGQVSADTLQFDTSLAMEEDYDVLLRICAKYRSDFGLIGTCIGDYHYKTDGSNTVSTEGGLSGQALARYMKVKTAIEERRRTTNVSTSVQRMLGLPASETPLTIHDVLGGFSSGWLSAFTRRRPVANTEV